jgi:hypothetical protein
VLGLSSFPIKLLGFVIDDGDREGPKARFQMRTHKEKPAVASDAPAARASSTQQSMDQTPAEQAPGADNLAQPSASHPRTTVRKSASAA